MNSDLLTIIAKLRIYIGYLGEKDQYGWWKSSFFTTSSDAFLAPLFSRTKLLAQVNGVSRAASLLHDEHIGVGNVYHLFRLPENLEQGLHQKLKDQEFTKALPKPLTQAVVMSYLKESVKKFYSEEVGPVRIGSISDLYTIDAWVNVATSYLNAFTNHQIIYPYFSDLL
jgi:hypothetical protein